MLFELKITCGPNIDKIFFFTRVTKGKCWLYCTLTKS